MAIVEPRTSIRDAHATPIAEDEGPLREYTQAALHCQRCRAQQCDASHPVRPALPTISVVLPAMNEEQNLPWVLGRVPAMVDEIILVDGHSRDNTVSLARRLLPKIRVVRQPHTGKGDAVAAGLLEATCDVIIMMDLDGSMDPAEIPLFVGALLAGADVAKGSRRITGGGSDDLTAARRLGNYALTKFANAVHRSRWSELCFGYAAFWRDSIDYLGVDELASQPTRPPGRIWTGPGYGHGFEIEALLFCRARRSKLRISEVSCHEYVRRNGSSNLVTIRDGLRVAIAILKETRWHRSR